MAELRFRKAVVAVSSTARGSILRSDVAQVVAHTAGIGEVEASSASVGSTSRCWPKTEALIFQIRLSGWDTHTSLHLSGHSSTGRTRACQVRGSRIVAGCSLQVLSSSRRV